MGVDFTEVAALGAELLAVPGKVEPRAKVVVKKVGLDTVSDGQVNAPKDTGHLASTISVDFDPDGMGFEAGPTAEYGGFVEDGTEGPYVIPGAFGRDGFVMHPGISPQPYMGPAFDDNVDQVERALGKIGEDLLR